MKVEIEIKEGNLSTQMMKDLKRLKRVWKMKTIEEVLSFLISRGVLKLVKNEIELHTDAIFGPKRKLIKTLDFKTIAETASIKISDT